MKRCEEWDSINRKISGKIARKISNKDNSIAIIHYGINIMMNGLEKLIILMLIFGIFGYLETFLVAAMVMFILRIWIGGTHRKSMLGCVLQSGIVFTVVIYLSTYDSLLNVCAYPIMATLLIIDIIYCPIINERRGQYSKKKRTKFKIYSCICIVILNVLFRGVTRKKEVLAACEIVQTIDVVLAKLIEKRKKGINL